MSHNLYGGSNMNSFILHQYMGLGISPVTSVMSGYPVSPLQVVDQEGSSNYTPVLYRIDSHNATSEKYQPMNQYQGQDSPQGQPAMQHMHYDFEGYNSGFTPQMNSSPYSKFKTHKKSKSLPSKISSQSLMNKFQSGSGQSNTGQKAKSSGSSFSSGSVMSESVLSSKIEYPIHKISKSTVSSGDRYENLKKNVYPSIEVKKYSTSAIDPIRNYLTVFEYSINNQWVIWDYQTGFVHLTGIWKAALSANDYISNPNIKADIVKLLESTPKRYHEYIKRIRGGFLKIQGTWLPYGLCRMLARRFSYYIRYELIPIFGIDFPDYCLHPSDPRFGELRLDEVNGESSNQVKPGMNRKQSTMKYKKSHSTSSIMSSKGSGKPKKTNKIDKEKLHRLNTMESPEQHKFKFPEVTTPVFRNTNILPPPMSCPAQFSGRDNIAYCDMVEIVNASKCLQSLSKSNSNANLSQISPISLDYDSMNFTAPQPNYVTTSGTYDRAKNDTSNGISSILLAAGISEKSTNSSISILDHKPIPKASMKIDDLLS